MSMLILAEIRDARGRPDNRREFVLVLNRRQADDAGEVAHATHKALGEPAFIALRRSILASTSRTACRIPARAVRVVCLRPRYGAVSGTRPDRERALQRAHA